MKKRKILATGTIVASMLLSGAIPGFAQTTTRAPKAQESTLERETLIEEGFSPSQIHKVLTQESHQGKKGKR